MKITRTRLIRYALLGASLGSLAALAEPAQAQSPMKAFDIPAQPLSMSLLEFSRQSDVLIVVAPELTQGKRAPALKGMLPVNEAIARLLRGSGLVASPNPRGGYVVERRRSAGREPRRAPEAVASSADTAADSGSDIVVTAQKRGERLRDVPIPVTALKAQTLAKNNQVRLQDYFSQIPGLNLNTDGRSGIPTISIRGITTGGFSNSSVGIVVDDVPYGSQLTYGGGSLAPDFDPSDLEQIEVLRGPQGTLYGASSMGGLIKYTTLAPSLDGVSGRIQLGTSAIENGNGMGYVARAAINLPVGNTLAVRVSGFARRAPGYVDDPLLDRDGVNREEAKGARVALRWQPTDYARLTVSGLIQNIRRDGSPSIQPALGDLRHSELIGTGDSRRTSRVFSAIAKIDMARATLTSVTGYNTNRLRGSSDFSVYASFFDPAVTGEPYPDGVAFTDDNRSSRFTQEVRVETPLTDSIDWLVGGFYQHESSSWSQKLIGVGLPRGDRGTTFVDFFNTIRFSEYAVFTDLTLKLGERLDVQVGARQSHENESYSVMEIGPAVPIFTNGLPSPYVKPEARSSADVFTYLLTPRFRFSPDHMIYARFASGYRPGGPNPLTLGSLATYKPDQTRNYEVGAKGVLGSGLLTYDASLYQIDWQDIQLSVTVAGNSINSNGSRAKSQGAELSLGLKPSSGLSISAWGAFNRAVLTRALPAATGLYGLAGDRLPYSSRLSGSLSATQTVRLGDALTGSFGGSISYVGKRISVFTASPDRQVLPAYTQIDLRVGVEHRDWELNVYANNLTDRRGMLSGGVGSINSTSFNVIQPRSIGVSIAKAF